MPDRSSSSTSRFTSGSMPGSTARALEVAVIGAGFAGIAAAIELAQAGIAFTVFDRGDEVGGTWRDNTYPGCACDIPSHLYSLSFALNPDWSRAYPPQPEILEYLVARHRPLRAATVDPLRHRDHRGPLRRAHRPMGVAHHRRGGARGRRGHQRHRSAVPAVGARRGRSRHLRGHRVPLGPLAPRPRPAGREGGRGRHRGQRHPVRARDRPGGRPPHRLPAHPAVGAAP